MGEYNTGPDGYLKHIEIVKKSVSIPVFASLNAMSHGGWTAFAKLIESAGADALELNIFFVPTDPGVSPELVEDRYVETVASVRSAISIPLAVKFGPYFTALANTAGRMAQAGADGLILFNRYLAPDIDINRYEVRPSLELSDPAELRLAPALDRDSARPT